MKFNRVLTCAFLSLLLTAPVAAEEMSVTDRLEQIGPGVRGRIKPLFIRQRVSYPPARLVLAVIKSEMRLKIYASDSEDPDDNNWRFIAQYQLAKLSGKPGPKLRNGDKQVPEGVYNISYLHPTSKYWLSLGLDYPNSFDRARAHEDGRRGLGGDIMIHGWWYSTGCVAVGNTAAEDLFVLAGDTKPANVKVIISPVDFRSNSTDDFKPPAKPDWVSDLYENLDHELDLLGTDGLTTDTRLIAYSDLAPPPPVKRSFLAEFVDALVEAAETSASQSSNSDVSTSTQTKRSSGTKKKPAAN